MNNIDKKISKVLNTATYDDLTEYGDILKSMKKTLGLPFFGTRKLAAALLKEYLGNVADYSYDGENFPKAEAVKDDVRPAVKEKGDYVFEDVKDGKARLFINIGKAQRIVPGDIIREIVKKCGINGKLIGKIDIHQNYSFIEVPLENADIILSSMNGVRVRGVNIVLEPAKKKKPNAAVAP